jgi:hypothetical protein
VYDLLHSFVGNHLLADHCQPLRTATLAFSITSGALMVAILPGDYFFIQVKNPQVICVPSRYTVINDLKMVA